MLWIIESLNASCAILMRSSMFVWGLQQNTVKEWGLFGCCYWHSGMPLNFCRLIGKHAGLGVFAQVELWHIFLGRGDIELEQEGFLLIVRCVWESTRHCYESLTWSLRETFLRINVRQHNTKYTNANQKHTPNQQLTRQPHIKQDYPLNLSILISGGKETNKDSRSSGERSGKSLRLESGHPWCTEL